MNGRTATGALLAAASLLSGCAAQTYVRESAVLDAPDIDQYRVVYEPFDGCLLRQELPQRYSVVRPLYRLELQVRAADAGASPAIDVMLSGAGGISAVFPGAEPQPALAASGEYSRYRVALDSLDLPVLTVEVMQGERQLGREQLRIEPRRCHALGF